MKLKKNDNIQVIRGKDKGKTGKIERVLPKEKKVLVTNVNMYKRHMKARSQNQPSEIITLTKPLPEASVAFVCPKCHKIARIGYKIGKQEKTRICRNCKAEV